MNWNAKEMNEIALNQIWSEHVRELRPTKRSGGGPHLTPLRRKLHIHGPCARLPSRCVR